MGRVLSPPRRLHLLPTDGVVKILIGGVDARIRASLKTRSQPSLIVGGNRQMSPPCIAYIHQIHGCHIGPNTDHFHVGKRLHLVGIQYESQCLPLAAELG